MWPSEIKKDCVEYSTGLPYPKGKVILESIKGQLSDGYWENSIRMEGYWKFFCLDAKGGEAVLSVSKRSHIYSYGYTRPTFNKFLGKTHREILEWFARRIYEIAKYEEKTWPEDEFRMAKGNGGVSVCLGGMGNHLTGHDVWALRKTLLNYARLL